MYNDNPYLNIIVYVVEFPVGTVREYSANMIAENMLSNVDSDKFTIIMINVIIYHRIDTEVAVSKSDMCLVICCG